MSRVHPPTLAGWGWPDSWAWEECDAAAEWCAAKVLTGEPGCELPYGLSVKAHKFISGDPDAFAERVRGFAYARAMGGS